MVWCSQSLILIVVNRFVKMGRRNKGRNKGKSGRVKRVSKPSVLESDDETLYKDLKQPDERADDYYYDEVDEYHQEKEKLLLKDEECPLPRIYDQEEVLGLGEDGNSSDYDVDDDYNDNAEDEYHYAANEYNDDDQIEHIEQDDLEDTSDTDKEDKGLPDIKAWGKRLSTYYNTDYVDEDYYRGFRESDIEAAEAEEEEVLALQKRLDEEMEENDFGFDWIKKKKEKNVEIEENIAVDMESMSKDEKLEFLRRKSPEFFYVIDDFKMVLTELKEKLEPVIALIKNNKVPQGPWIDYVVTKFQIIIQYCTNISFYMMLKAKGIDTSSHPVVKRLLTYKNLLEELDKLSGFHMPIIESLIKGEDINPLLENSHPVNSIRISDHKNEEIKLSEKQLMDVENIDFNENYKTDSSENEERRGITYQIAKNKGLVARRKKELRNPRVKHRRKYERAKTRRKGQYREPIKELQRYGGEVSGIRIGVTRSTKLK